MLSPLCMYSGKEPHSSHNILTAQAVMLPGREPGSRQCETGKGRAWGQTAWALRRSCCARAVLFMRAYSQPMPSSGSCSPGNRRAAVRYAAIACREDATAYHLQWGTLIM